jgi:hypothetical protein
VDKGYISRAMVFQDSAIPATSSLELVMEFLEIRWGRTLLEMLLLAELQMETQKAVPSKVQQMAQLLVLSDKHH